MNIIFEKTSAPETYGGNVRSLAPHHARRNTPRDSIIPFPSGSIQTAGSAFKHREPLQSFYDCLAVIAGFLLVSVTGVGLAFALFVLMFVRL